jgi:hypothetical protein
MHHSRFITRAFLGALILVVLMPAAALGISRDVVLARGKVWVDKHVPYSQTRFAKLDGTLLQNKTDAQKAYARANGYRTDCSGYVSMCLGLRNSVDATISLTTRSLSPSVLTTISKSAVLPGDVLLKRGSHVLLFVRWVDSEHKQFKGYEERGTDYGCVETTRTYSDMSRWGYYAYRYKQIDDFYPDYLESVYGPTDYDTAVAASRVSFPPTSTPTVDALVISSSGTWPGNLGGAALAGAAEGPLLMTATTSLSSTASAAIKRLKPARVYVMGGRSSVATAVSEKIASLGPEVVRVSGADRYATAANAAITAVSLARASERTVDAAYLVGSDSFAEGLAVSPIAAKTARPILLTRKTAVPGATLDALKKTGIKRVYIVGGTRSVSVAVARTLKQRGITVVRKVGVNPYRTALVMVHHGTRIPDAGLTWNRLGVVSGTQLKGTLACGVAQGQAGSMLVFTPGTKLYSGAATEISEHRAGIGKVRVFGGYNVIGLTVRSSIAKLMRAK